MLLASGERKNTPQSRCTANSQTSMVGVGLIYRFCRFAQQAEVFEFECQMKTSFPFQLLMILHGAIST